MRVQRRGFTMGLCRFFGWVPLLPSVQMLAHVRDLVLCNWLFLQPSRIMGVQPLYLFPTLARPSQEETAPDSFQFSKKLTYHFVSLPFSLSLPVATSQATEIKARKPVITKHARQIHVSRPTSCTICSCTERA